MPQNPIPQAITPQAPPRRALPGMSYSVERAAKSLFGSMTSGEGYVRVYQGSGKLLMAPIPSWRQRMHASLTSLTHAASKK